MAKLSFFADNRRPDKYGNLPIRLLLSNGTSTTTISTGISTSPKYFVGEPTQVLMRTAPQSQEYNRILYNLYARYFNTIIELEHNNCIRYMTAAEIRKFAEEDKMSRMGNNGYTDFISFFKEYGEGRNTENTRRGYTYAVSILYEYCKARHIRELRFSDVNYSMLTDFARWIRSTGRGENTRHILESYVRAAYKDAEKRHIISRENDPYFDYSIAPVPQKDIDILTAEEVYRLANAHFDTKSKRLARDVAMMSFYMCGVNLLDMYEMSSPSNGEVVYIRHKTEGKSLRPVHIRIESELQSLIDKYKGGEHLFYFKETYSKYDTFKRRIGKTLNEISTELGTEYTMAKIRRTWSSIAGMLEVSDRVIDKSMGHMDKSVKDRHYEHYDWNRTARANRMVMDYVLKQHK